MSAKMERVDSATTEDSPFASSLTTPVDEEVQIHFHNKGLRMGIEERLSGLCNEKTGGEFTGSAVYTGLLENIQGEEISVSRREFSRELEAKLSTLDPMSPTNTLTPLLLMPDSTPGEEPISPVLLPRASTIVTPDMCQNISNQTLITFESQGSTAESTPDLRPRSESIYNLPNEQIIVETQSEYYPSSEVATNDTTSVIESLPFSCSTPSALRQTTEMANLVTRDLDLTLKPSNDSLKPKASLQSLQATVDPVLDAPNDSLRPTPQNDLSSLSFGDENDTSSTFLALGTQNTNLTSLYPSSLTDTLLLILRVLLFLPWCVAVGGTIVMYPQHLEHVAFGLGYTKSPKGIRRFAHWADTGIQHLWIFFGFLASMWWIYPILGWMLIGGVVAQTANAWQDFKVDRSIPLGEDDRQTIYLVAKQYGLPDELMGISKTDQGYLISKLDRPRVEYEDVIDDE